MSEYFRQGGHDIDIGTIREYWLGRNSKGNLAHEHGISLIPGTQRCVRRGVREIPGKLEFIFKKRTKNIVMNVRAQIQK
jgi:hypothetical protein